MFKITTCLLFLSGFCFSDLSAQTKNISEKINYISEVLYFNFNYKGEVFSNVSGGMETKNTYLDNIDIILDMNFEELIGWKGAILNTHVLGNHGGDPTEYAGAAQGISNIAAFETWKLYQFYLEQILFDDNLSILAGLFDLNSEFDTRETSGIFINPSHGIGAEYALTGQNGPSIFPYTSLALRVKYNFSNSFDIKAAIFDGVPGDLERPGGTHIKLNEEDGVLFSAEASYKSESEKFADGFFRYTVGGWYYTSEFEKLHTDDVHEIQKGNYGVYISGEKFLFSESENSPQGLAAFLRIGFADKNVNQVDAYYGAGINYTGLIPGRDEDVLGLAIASIHNNDKFSEEDFNIDSYEHIVELTYQFKAAEWLNIQPDVQYVYNPTHCNCNEYSFVFGTRFELAL